MGKRRPSGDGLVRKRADGRWEGRIVVGHKEDGKPIYRSVFAEKQGDLMPKLHELKDQYAGVELTEDSSITLGEWLERWLNEYKKPILRPSTYAGYSKASFTLDHYAHVTSDMQKNAANIVTNYITDILGKELKPWQSEEKRAKDR